MTSDEFTKLRTTSSPYLLLVDSTPAAMERIAWALAASGITVRMLRGERMRQQSRLFSEFAAALQFPYYFGENWNAFDECITDLEWLPGEAYVLIVTNADQVLREDG